MIAMNKGMKSLFALCFFWGLMSTLHPLHAEDDQENQTDNSQEIQEENGEVGGGEPLNDDILVEEESIDKETVGAETIGFSDEEIGNQGNWIKKNRYAKDAQELMSEIHDIIVDIKTCRQETYRDKAFAIDEEFEDFYSDMGIKQGSEAQLFIEISKEIDGKLEQLRLKSKGTNQQIADKAAEYYAMADNLVAYKAEIEQLRLDVEAVVALDKSIGDRIEKLDEYVGKADETLEMAEKINKQILYIIDHEKARQAYYRLKGNSEKIKAIQEYLKETLAADFDKVVDHIKEHIKKTQDSVKSIEDKGIKVRNRLQEIKPEEVKKDNGLATLDATSEKNTQEDAAQEAAKKAKIPAPKPLGFFDQMGAIVVGFFSMISDALKFILAFIFGGK